MDLLDRYLIQIRRYLPFRDREETITELRSLILDQLDQTDNPNKDAALRQIIVEMGEPREVAQRYNERGPIISKEMEPIMMLVIKITSITLPLVILFADSIAYVTGTPDATFFGFLLNFVIAIPSTFYPLLVGIGMVFLIFYLIERYLQPKFSIEHKDFVPELLPELPKKEFKVTILGSVLTILVNVLILYIANFHLDVLALYNNGQSVPVFNSNMDPFIILLSAGWIATTFLHVYYLYRTRKDMISRTIEFVLSVYGAVILILVGTSDVFNDLVLGGADLNFIRTMLRWILPIVGVMAIIGATVEYVKMYVNLNKLEELSNQKK